MTPVKPYDNQSPREVQLYRDHFPGSGHIFIRCSSEKSAFILIAPTNYDCALFTAPQWTESLSGGAYQLKYYTITRTLQTHPPANLKHFCIFPLLQSLSKMTST